MFYIKKIPYKNILINISIIFINLLYFYNFKNHLELKIFGILRSSNFFRSKKTNLRREIVVYFPLHI